TARRIACPRGSHPHSKRRRGELRQLKKFCLSGMNRTVIESANRIRACYPAFVAYSDVEQGKNGRGCIRPIGRPIGKVTMTRSDSDDKSVLLVNAYLDGELDPANALGVTQQMDKEPALASEAERIKALQQSIHKHLPREEAPPGLGARIESSVGGVRRDRVWPTWRALAASIALTAIVSSSSTWLMVGSQQQPTMIADALVSDHIRALMASEPVDVISSDRHTVKPWFNGRIIRSPRVVDLAKEDFTLIGGRVDVV